MRISILGEKLRLKCTFQQDNEDKHISGLHNNNKNICFNQQLDFKKAAQNL